MTAKLDSPERTVNISCVSQSQAMERMHVAEMDIASNQMNVPVQATGQVICVSTLSALVRVLIIAAPCVLATESVMRLINVHATKAGHYRIVRFQYATTRLRAKQMYAAAVVRVTIQIHVLVVVAMTVTTANTLFVMEEVRTTQRFVLGMENAHRRTTAYVKMIGQTKIVKSLYALEFVPTILLPCALGMGRA